MTLKKQTNKKKKPKNKTQSLTFLMALGEIIRLPLIGPSDAYYLDSVTNCSYFLCLGHSFMHAAETSKPCENHM